MTAAGTGAPVGSRTPRQAWIFWIIGLLAYASAVFQRSSLGVAGLVAQHRFGASAAVLSLFSVLQLGVYAAMQVPVGALLDRFGSRRLLVAGAAVMAGGQVTLALAHSVPAAIVARLLVGCGDAMTFISVLRVVTLWFADRHVPLVTQLTGILGQVGQIAAAYPLVTLLHGPGWTTSFLIAAAIAGGAGALVGAGLRDAPAGSASVAAPQWTEVVAQLRQAWREPGTRIGLWTHFTTQFSGTVFALLWGYPFLVAGEGLSPGEAGALLTLLVVAGMVVGPLMGRLVARFPLRRSVLVLAITGGSALAWAVVLVWPGRAPLAVLVVLVTVLATNGPGSMIGFDYARTFNPVGRLGSATGIVNVGGFVASLTMILIVGVVLDASTGSGPAGSYSLGAFRVAFAVQYAFWLGGLGGVLHNRRVLRRRLAESGVTIDPLRHAVRRHAVRRQATDRQRRTER